MTDDISTLVRRLIESDDIQEVRRLRQQLNAVIRERMNELRTRAAVMAVEITKREGASKKQRAYLKQITVLANVCRDCYISN